MLVGDTLPDRWYGDIRFRLDHRVDVSMQAVQGGWFAVDFLVLGRVGAGPLIPAESRPARHAARGSARGAVAALVLGALMPGTGGQAGSRSAGSSGRPTSARIRWLIASVIPKVSH